jgi:hypothetical protein
VMADRPMRHPLVQEREIGDLLEILAGATSEKPADAPAGP